MNRPTTIDILDSDCVEFSDRVERLAGSRAEAQQARHTIDSAIGVLGTLTRGFARWVPDNQPVNDAEALARLLGVIRSLRDLSARFGDTSLLCKLAEVCDRLSQRLADPSSGPHTEVYASLRAPAGDLDPVVRRGPLVNAWPAALATGSPHPLRRPLPH